MQMGRRWSATSFVGEYDEIVDAINKMQQQASACLKDASKCAFTNSKPD